MNKQEDPTHLLTTYLHLPWPFLLALASSKTQSTYTYWLATVYLLPPWPCGVLFRSLPWSGLFTRAGYNMARPHTRPIQYNRRFTLAGIGGGG